MADLPFMSYTSREQALANSVRLMQEGGARDGQARERRRRRCDIVEFLAGHDIAGLRAPRPEAAVGAQDRRLPRAGPRAAMPPSACSPSAKALRGRGRGHRAARVHSRRSWASAITEALHVPVIGIGAGPDTDGQILVLYDILDITSGRKPRFVRNFMAGRRRLLAGDRAPTCARCKDAQLSGARALLHMMVTLPMRIVHTVAEVRAQVRCLARGRRCASRFVPTMGNLHAGHISLLELRAPAWRPRRRQHLRQSAAVRARTRTSTAIRARPTTTSAVLQEARLRPAVRARRATRCIPRAAASATLRQRAAACREILCGAVPSRAFRRRGHRGRQAVRHRAARTSRCSARRTSSSCRVIRA